MVYVGTAGGTVVALRLPDTSPGSVPSTGEPSGENTPTEEATTAGAAGGESETGELGGVKDAGDASTGPVASTGDLSLAEFVAEFGGAEESGATASTGESSGENTSTEEEAIQAAILEAVAAGAGSAEGRAGVGELVEEWRYNVHGCPVRALTLIGAPTSPRR